MIEDFKYIDGVRYTLYGVGGDDGIKATERAREKGFKARRFKKKDEDGNTVYVVYVLRQV